MIALREARHISLMLLTLSAAACGAGSAPARVPEDVIAVVGGRDISREAFDKYLLSTLGDVSAVAGAGPDVLSRLLDQFLDQEMLVGEALKEGMELTDDQVKFFMGEQTGDPDRVRAVLLEKRYKEEVILKDIDVTEDEITGYFRNNLASFHRPSRVVMAKILLDDAEEARSVHAEVMARPADFEILAEEHSLSPDGGRSQAYEEETLPDSIRAMAANLEKGQISPIVQDPQGFFILRLEDRRPEQSPSLEEVRDEIELKLLQEKSETKYRDALRELHARTAIVINKGKLAFPYQEKAAS